MPTYEYKCQSCGHELEAIQSMRDDALTLCPHCNKSSLRRLISRNVGISFKGSGFYVTDSSSSKSSVSTEPKSS